MHDDHYEAMTSAFLTALGRAARAALEIRTVEELMLRGELELEVGFEVLADLRKLLKGER